MSLLVSSEYYLYSDFKYLAIKEVWRTYDKRKSHVPNFKGTRKKMYLNFCKQKIWIILFIIDLHVNKNKTEKKTKNIFIYLFL